MSSQFCSVYAGSGTIWPVRQFPSASFPRGSPARLRDAARAWAFFEQVEAYDAAIRVKYSSLGGFMPSNKSVVTQAPWFMFKNEGERIMYKRGQSLHRELCPETNWASQRNLGISTIPETDVYPGVCSVEPEIDIFSFMVGQRSIVTPTLSGQIGLFRGIVPTSPSLSGLNAPTSSGQISTSSSSRRDSINHT